MRQPSHSPEVLKRTVICLLLAETVDALAGAATVFYYAGVAIWLLYTMNGASASAAPRTGRSTRSASWASWTSWRSCRCGRSRDSI